MTQHVVMALFEGWHDKSWWHNTLWWPSS